MIIVANYHQKTIHIPLPVQRLTARNGIGRANLLTHKLFAPACTYLDEDQLKTVCGTEFCLWRQNLPKTVANKKTTDKMLSV